MVAHLLFGLDYSLVPCGLGTSLRHVTNILVHWGTKKLCIFVAIFEFGRVFTEIRILPWHQAWFNPCATADLELGGPGNEPTATSCK